MQNHLIQSQGFKRQPTIVFSAATSRSLDSGVSDRNTAAIVATLAAVICNFPQYQGMRRNRDCDHFLKSRLNA